MNKILEKIKYLLPISVLVFLPSLVFASDIYIDTSHSEFHVGDSVVFNVRIDSLNKTINAIEGNVLLNYSPESVSIHNLNISESDLSLWPHKPTISDDFKAVSFSGGVPKGLNSTNAIIFKIVLNFKKAGQIKLTPSDISVYLNDGKGTKDVVSGKGLFINVLPQKPNSQAIDDWGNQVSNDTTSPEPFEILAAQDDSVFEGKKFLSFNAVDKESGISYYEVIEGNLPPIRSDKTYILKEQDKPVKITIIAYDASGNTRKSEYNPGASAISYSAILKFTALAIIIKLLIVIFKRKKKDALI